MSATITSIASASSSAAANCGALLYDIPVADPACAVPFGGNHTDVLKECCKDANIISYREDCGIYCLALGQDVEKLAECLRSEGAAPQDVFCNRVSSAVTESATGEASVPTTASASVIAGKGTTEGSDKSATKSGSDDKATETGSSAGSKATKSDSAAAGVRPSSGISTVGVVIGALLFSATAFGAFQI